MSYLDTYFSQAQRICGLLDLAVVDRLVERLARLRTERGRLFVVGVGGSAANALHMVTDLRKIAHIDARTPAENVAELTARINDEGWENAFADWLALSEPGPRDALFVLSVGGGNAERRVSVNLVRAIDYAHQHKVDVLGIVGRDGGHTKKLGTCVLVIPTVDAANTTPHAESMQAVVWHGMVCDPRLQAVSNKWEGIGHHGP